MNRQREGLIGIDRGWATNEAGGGFRFNIRFEELGTDAARHDAAEKVGCSSRLVVRHRNLSTPLDHASPAAVPAIASGGGGTSNARSIPGIGAGGPSPSMLLDDVATSAVR